MPLNNQNILRLASLFLLLFFIHEGNAGSSCPPREDIHPCICLTIPMSKKSTFTIVMCSHLSSATALTVPSIYFRQLDIDRLIIIDSFLQAKKLYGSEADKHQTLPQDWLSRLKIRELEIIDSAVASCFICESSTKCQNQYQTHMSVTNSSATDTICTICKAANEARFPWTGCMTSLKHFSFTGNRLSAVEKDLFPEVMKELLTLNLSSNRIAKVGRDAFKNLPELTSLDMSHNLVEVFSGDMFGNASNPNLKFVDFSWNHIVTLAGNVLTLLPNLEILKLNNNLIRKVKKQPWNGLFIKTMRTIDLTDNPICCDCDWAWLNSSLPVHTAVLGTCFEPDRFQVSPLRQASKLLQLACSDDVKKLNITKCSA